MQDLQTRRTRTLGVTALLAAPLLGAAAAFLATTVASSAADLAPVHTKAPAAVYSWTGFYIGGNLGAGMASSHFDDPNVYGSSATPTRGFFTGGAQIGYNYQFGSGLVGIEADVNGNSGLKGAAIGGADSQDMAITTKADVSGTIRARAGVVVNNALLYVTGGAAWANVGQTGVELNNYMGIPNFGTPTGTTANRSGILWGGVIGAGAEFALGPHWILGAEFLRMMYQDRAANIIGAHGNGVCGSWSAASCVIRDQLTTDVARVRLSYKFGDPVQVSTDAGLAYANAPVYTKAAAATAYSWTGFYIGVNAGGGTASSRFDDPCYRCSSAKPTGDFFTGGAQVGYNYQFGSGLVGVEADVNGNSDFRGSVIGGNWPRPIAVTTKADVSGTIRARAGVVVNNALVYVTGGAAWANVQQTGTEFVNDTASPAFGSLTGTTANRGGVLWGGTIGAGVEFALGSNWIVGAEFLHTVYQDRGANLILADGSSVCAQTGTPATNCVIRNQLTTDVARARVSYKFGDPPVSARGAPVAMVYNWTGFYIGGNLGGGMASSYFDDPCYYCSNAAPTGGFFTGGGQIGYNYQFGKGLVGIEADVSGNSNFKGSVLGGNGGDILTVAAKADVSGSIRGRAGLVVDNALVYVTGGAAWADVRQTGTEFVNWVAHPAFGTPTGITANRSGILWGGVIGAGVEFALSPNWIVGGEFLHTKYEDRGANIVNRFGANACDPIPASNCVIRNLLTTDVARLRVSYKFGQ